MKKSNYKEDQEGYESPIKSYRNLDQLANAINTPASFPDSYLLNSG